MRPLLYTVSTVVVMALAFWAYREGYETRASERAVRQLHDDIAAAREDLAMLRAEWTYLNRPDRLRVLAEMNFERLGLMPLRADHYGQLDEVAFPPPPPPAPEHWASLGETMTLDGMANLAARPAEARDGEQLP